MKTQPHHRGEECPRCLRPTPTQVAWDELGEDDGPDLCWQAGLSCDDRRDAAIARLRAEVAKYREALDVIATCPRGAEHLMPLAAQAALAHGDPEKT